MSWSSLCKKANPLALDLLDKMLQFNPSKRITVEEALAHPYLATLHCPDDEPSHPAHFDFAWERDLKLEKPVLQRHMYEEILAFRKGKLPYALPPPSAPSAGTVGTATAAAAAAGGAGAGAGAAGPSEVPDVVMKGTAEAATTAATGPTNAVAFAAPAPSAPGSAKLSRSPLRSGGALGGTSGATAATAAAGVVHSHKVTPWAPHGAHASSGSVGVLMPEAGSLASTGTSGSTASMGHGPFALGIGPAVVPAGSAP